MQENSEITNNHIPFLIIGSGYAGISLATHLSENNFHLPITIFTTEDFCNRPNLFFRYKFLKKEEIDFYGNVNLNQMKIYKKKILSIYKNNSLTCQNLMTLSIETYSFDYLVLATGGKPNVIKFPMEPLSGAISTTTEKSISTTIKLFEILKEKYTPPNFLIEKDINNFFYLRNVDEILYLYDFLKQFIFEENFEENLEESLENQEILENGNSKNHEEPQIVVLGSGILALDFTSHLLEGYELLLQKVKLPKITIISRSSILGKSLLKDEKASELLTNKLNKYTNYLNLELNDEIATLKQYNNSIVKVITKNGKELNCCCVIEAVGVSCNLNYLKPNNNENNENPPENTIQPKIGALGGILVNENFQILNNENNDNNNLNNENNNIYKNIFSIGDVCEMITDFGNVNCKNWTAAREQAILLGDYLLEKRNEKSFIFNQFPKLFNLYISCLGWYHSDGFNLPKMESVTFCNENCFYKMSFMESSLENSLENVTFVGAIFMGGTLNDYKLGNTFLNILKEKITFPKTFISKFTQKNLLNLFNEILKEKKKIFTIEELENILQKVEKAEQTPKKKFVNPLLLKKKNKEVVAKEEKEGGEVDDSLGKEMKKLDLNK
ncbi:hypothetical protein ABK040_014268 [Willaertia magna]